MNFQILKFTNLRIYKYLEKIAKKLEQNELHMSKFE